jgi:hypothetical protein
MGRFRYSASLLALSFMLIGCATAKPQVSQVQIREFQTREFQADAKVALKACLNALQDDGYIVKNAVPDLGLLSATKQLDVESRGEAIFALLFAGPSARYKKNSETEVTVNVSEFGKQSKVRANFVVKVIDNHGGVLKVEQIAEESFYREFFAKVDKAIFLQNEKL